MAAVAQEKPASDAETRKTFESVCSQCHELSLITERRALHDVWAKVVRRMDAEGAGASDAQYLSIIDYLTRNYGPERLNVNEASADDFAVFFAISQSDAEAIVKYRASNGKYKTAVDLSRSGADRKKIEAKKDAIDF
jgi:competence ComEA-like helix-hairpin-helix protein